MRTAAPARGEPASRTGVGGATAVGVPARFAEIRSTWTDAYVRHLTVADAGCALVGAVVGYTRRFGSPGRGEYVDLWIAALLPAVWVFVLLAVRSYEKRFLWLGPEEFRRVFFASALLLATVGTTSWAFRLEVARGFLVVALPLTALLTLAQRFTQRRWLHRQRRRGRCLQTMLLVGHRRGVADLRDRLQREPVHGYRVIGCCLPSGSAAVHGLPLLGCLTDVVDVVLTHDVDSVAVLPSPELEGAALQQLGWDLEATAAELLVAPAVTGIVGPRVRIRPVSGLSLLHVDRPELRGLRRVAKGALDRVGAAVLIALFLPVLVAATVAVRCTSRGPVFFRQERIGCGARSFTMVKFRTMYVGADHLLTALRERSDGNGVLFKLRADPRITRVGKILRRFSIDELPQLFNVVKGDMSLVGPRPPLPSETERYGFDMRRRFLVKPGLTGLWQVSGRSDLSWNDSVRFDVHYVENWSLTFDLMILCKTVGAVVRGRGAY